MEPGGAIGTKPRKSAMPMLPLLGVTIVFFSCATAPGTGRSSGDIRTQWPVVSAPSTTTAKTTSRGVAGAERFYRLPAQGPEFWESMMTRDVAREYQAVNGVSQCTRFVGDMLTEFFGRDVFTRVFPDGLLGANETFNAWARNDELIRLSPHEFTIMEIQELVDSGYLVLMAYYYPKIAGHAAFVGYSDLDLFSLPPISGLEGNSGRTLDRAWFPVMVQAGTYTGITSMVYATNGWLRDDNYGAGIVRYYALRA